MTELGTHFERSYLGGGRYGFTQHLRPIAYREAGGYKRIANDWTDGDQDWPHVVTRAPFLVSVGGDGLRRIHPTREPDRYFEFGAPYIKPAGSWQKVNLGAPVRSGSLLTWTTAQANVYIQMAGHYVKLGILLKGGWQPPGGQFAFPVGLAGLTRQGGNILADGQRVMLVRAPHVEDLDNPDDIRPILWDFMQVGGQGYALFTLPSLAGMARPLIDPTLTLQPGAADGLDARIDFMLPNTNYGTAGAPGLIVGEPSAGGVGLNRVLIKFSLTALPDTARISSANLSLYCTGDDSAVASVYRVYRQRRAWVETEATWNVYSTGNNWQTAGGFGANDCEQVAIGSRNMTATETLNEFKTWALTPTKKADLDLGNGWLIKSSAETDDQYLFASSDYATAANRPKLEIVYRLMRGPTFFVRKKLFRA